MEWEVKGFSVLTDIDAGSWFTLDWWNAEYIEPNCSEIPTGSTTKNDLALIHTEGLDEEIRCTMCTNSMKSDRGCDGSCVVNKDIYKAVMDAIEKRIIDMPSTLVATTLTETDIKEGIDTINRQAVDRLTWEYLRKATDENVAFYEHFLDLPPIEPIRPKGHWILADEQNKEDVENDNYRFICSECQCSDIHAKGTIVPYCWKCGADMREVEE